MNREGREGLRPRDPRDYSPNLGKRTHDNVPPMRDDYQHGGDEERTPEGQKQSEEKKVDEKQKE